MLAPAAWAAAPRAPSAGSWADLGAPPLGRASSGSWGDLGVLAEAPPAAPPTPFLAEPAAPSTIVPMHFLDPYATAEPAPSTPPEWLDLECVLAVSPLEPVAARRSSSAPTAIDSLGPIFLSEDVLRTAGPLHPLVLDDSIQPVAFFVTSRRA